jgi:drug/metabolite transporter (DMT)-like permease
MTAEKEHTVKGAVMMVAACAAFSVMAALVKYISYVDAFKTSLARFIIGIAILGTAAMAGKIRLDFNNAKLLFLRGLLGGAGIYITFLIFVKIGISKGTMLISIYPIFACLFAAVLLKEKLSLVTLPAVAGAIAGIYFLTVGGNGGLFAGFGPYEILAVLNGVMAGLAVTLIRKLHQTDSSYSIFWAQCVVGFWLVLMPANAGSCQLGWKEAVVLLGIGIAATTGQLLMTVSYKYLPIRVGTILGMLEPTFNYFVGVTLFAEMFSKRSLLGASLIIGSCLIVLAKGEEKVRQAQH